MGGNLCSGQLEPWSEEEAVFVENGTYAIGSRWVDHTSNQEDSTHGLPLCVRTVSNRARADVKAAACV